MTPATEQKRAQLRQYIESVLEPDKAVQGVVGIGSVAAGQAHAQSDNWVKYHTVRKLSRR